MVLRLRLARVPGPGGAKRHRPIYNIVLAQARSARDSKPMEVLGTYDPIPKQLPGADKGDRKTKDIKMDVSRTKYWLGVGAQPSDTVWRLLAMIGLLEPKYLPTGQQTQNALQAVRFQTHKPVQRPTAKGERQSVSEEVRKAGSYTIENLGVSNTSPKDPNAA